MTFIHLHQLLKDFVVFSLQDIKKLDPRFDRRRLTEWQAKEYLTKIRRGYYVFGDHEFDERTLFMVANRIYRPSYISLESAFSYYHLIPETVYATTSVSTNKTAWFQTPFGLFSYQKIARHFMFGSTLERVGRHVFRIAEPEKAILDFLYLDPSLETEEDFVGLRFNHTALREGATVARLMRYLKRFDNQRLHSRVERFLTVYPL